MARSVETLVDLIRKLTIQKQRGIAAIIGARVADAASRPLHWVYNQHTLDNILKNSETPEFWPENCSPYYSLPTGHCSPYNDTAYVGLLSLCETKGKVEIQHIQDKIKSFFGPGTEYWRCLTKRDERPVHGPWVQVAVVSFLENLKKMKIGPYGDSQNNQSDGFCLSIPIVAYHASNENLWESLLSNVVTILNTHKPTVEVIHAETLLLQAFVLGKENPFEYAKEQYAKVHPSRLPIFKEVEDALKQNKSHPLQVAELGKPCYLPGSFRSSYLAMLKTASFVDAVRLNMQAGGCSCSRANLIGSCFGAKYGIDGIPLEWLKKVNDIENLMEMTIKLFSNQN